ncbi:TetR/AcrR family transcriptional regulator [Mycobacterium camsae]|uniref:TetR/AcrR family transcriptional regulator n=1 Tax=Mycobacterium gordonae TaxID=1778 RepID=UPI001F11A8A3|nr:TetR/AcrR family transcriptional regulator [Mycobacterium gordonae]
MTAPPGSSTRQRLLEAAVTCIRRKGYAATTARDITELSGANLASIGYHFGSKDALLDEALIEATERWLRPLARQRRGAESAGLESELSNFVESLPGNRAVVLAFFEALPRVERSPVVRARLAEIYEQLRAGILDVLPPAWRDDTALASAIVALYDGILVQWLVDPDRVIDAPAMVAGLRRVSAGRVR